MKRSRNIRLILIGGLSAGALTGCSPSKPPVSAENVYTNDYYLPGVGYYHAPFQTWYPLPYNHYDPQKKLYYYGGQWGASPYQNITNISSPTPVNAMTAQSMRTDISRGGFGGTSHYYGGSYSFGG